MRIGPDHQPYFVPEILLQTLRDLPYSESAERTIDLPDVDVETGHVIVHFLYTSQYQTLPDTEEEPSPSYSRVGFKKAISAFIAAKNYKLTALQELARNEVHKCGENIAIAQAAHGIGKDTLSALQEDAVWLQDFIMRKAEQTFANNDEIFSSNSFFSGIKSHKLAKLLGQHVAKLYHSRVEELSRDISELKPRTPNQEVEEIDASSTVAPSNEVYADKQSAQLPPEVETPTDDWFFGLSKKQRKQKAAHIAKEDWGTSWSTVPQTEPEPAVEIATEPAVNTVPIEDAPPVTLDPAGGTAELTVDREDVEFSWASWSIGAGTKKKKKEKKSQVTASGEEAPGTESETLNTAENLPVTGPAFLDISSTDNAYSGPLEASAEVVNDLVLEPAAAIEGSPVIVEPPLINEQHDQWGIWGSSLSSSKKKKLKKKRDRAARIEASPPPPPPPPPPPAETDIVTTEDLIEPEQPFEPVPEPEDVPEKVPEVHESESHAAKASYDETVSVDMDSPDDFWCLSRYKHLTQDDQWRNSQQCKSYLNKVAMKAQLEKQMSGEF